ncbi:Glyoxalase-like domain containing protein [Desulfovibrio sp. X2]|uniref:VOC family protein n=1 Tax=Desulfovibrio sp. X2 TaxID=941449 RepID=UPI000358B7A0|nr:VOC family protein [Desulfovibrio sp. X2]EPR41661.1 Glyoxalase-like domain containing protein [Desulfovibrio sp. X2]
MDPMHTHGAFSWNELMTTDVEAAKKFYAALFGWTYEEMVIGGNSPMAGGTYTSAKVGESWAGGMMSMPAGEHNIPPHWGSYVTVDNVDDTLSLVEKHGGRVLVPAFDVPDVGRMGVFQDPQGAVLCIAAYSMP